MLSKNQGNLLNRYEFEPSPDGKWGGPQPDGSITGMIGMVARHEVNFGINVITITRKDFTTLQYNLYSINSDLIR